MSTEDIRWIQRFDHFRKALFQLKRAVDLSCTRSLSELEQLGLIQIFKHTHELAWNTLKDFLENRGVKNLYGAKDTTREAFKCDLIEDGETWMGMIKSRSLSSHTYNEDIAEEMADDITQKYFPEFKKLQTAMETLKAKTI